MVNTQKIKKRMKELKLSQGDLVNALNIKRPTMSQKINNVRPIGNEEIRGYTRIVVETDEDNPKTIAEITNELITSADGYRVRLTPEYD